jgi:topoisomerase IA-like protein
MAKYSKKAQSKVERAMHEEKRGQLKSGRSGKKVTNPKQAIAIGLSEARKGGAKVPKKAAKKKAAPKKAGKKKAAPKKAAKKKAAPRKKAAPKKR